MYLRTAAEWEYFGCVLGEELLSRTHAARVRRLRARGGELLPLFWSVHFPRIALVRITRVFCVCACPWSRDLLAYSLRYTRGDGPLDRYFGRQFSAHRCLGCVGVTLLRAVFRLPSIPTHAPHAGHGQAIRRPTDNRGAAARYHVPVRHGALLGLQRHGGSGVLPGGKGGGGQGQGVECLLGFASLGEVIIFTYIYPSTEYQVAGVGCVNRLIEFGGWLRVSRCALIWELVVDRIWVGGLRMPPLLLLGFRLLVSVTVCSC